MQLLERMLGVVAPHNCLVCGREGQLICHWCFEAACPPVPPRCYRCRAASPNSQICAKCHRHSPLRHVWVATEYSDVAKRLLHFLKFERATAAAEPLAGYMAETLPYLDPTTLITYIPAATSRVRQRGYDQARLMSRELVKQLQLSSVSTLARLGQSRQVGASRAQRRQQMEHAFRPLHQAVITKRSILLVDDVLTTGATLEAAAKVLKTAGAKIVDAVVFAQKL